MNKEQFIQKLWDEQADWETFLGQVPAERLVQPGACGKWSIKDVMGHAAAWERFVTARIRAHLRGGMATGHEQWGMVVGDSSLKDDALNEWLAQQISSWSFGEVLGMQRELRLQTVITIELMDEHTLTAPEVEINGLPWKKGKPLWQVIAEMSYEHLRDHRLELEHWLA